MAASFPTSVKTFTTKTAGAGILSEHVNAIQEEVVAIETELKKTTDSVVDHGGLAGLADNDHPQYGRPVFLTAQLTSTSWDGDAHSTTAKTLIDLSAVFNVPAGVKAVLANVAVRDSASAAAANAMLCLGSNNSALAGPKVSCSGFPNDFWVYGQIVVSCNVDGDIYYQVVASGAGTLDAYLEIWGYWL